MAKSLERRLYSVGETDPVKQTLFSVIGVLLVAVSLLVGYAELGYALHGSAEAWMVLSALICSGVLGVGMVRAGRSAVADAATQRRNAK